MDYLFLGVTGFALGVYGALIGVGGGFLLIPLLIFLYPQENPEFIAGISLTVIFFNALSGSVSYARMGRIDYKSALFFFLAMFPGAILGALSTSLLPRRLFNLAFGILMIAISIFLMARPEIKEKKAPPPARFCISRKVKEKNGTEHVFSYNWLLGMGIGFLISYIATVLGVGGGIIQVPVLVYLLNFPAHIATATSLFILMTTAGTAAAVHIATGAFFHGLEQTLALTVGVLFGAPFGARLSSRVQDRRLMRAMSLALVLVGIRTILAAF